MRTGIVGFVLLLGLSQPATVTAAVPKPRSQCSKLGVTQTYQGKTYTCIKAGARKVWDNGTRVKAKSNSAPAPKPTPTPTPTTVQVQLPTAGTACSKIGEKVVGSTTYARCSWSGHANSEQEALRGLRWNHFAVTSISTSKSNNYSTVPVEGATCTSSGDTFDVAGGVLECRWKSGRQLQWMRINTVKATFTNAASPVSIEMCKLQNSDSSADKSGRNSGAGVVGFPLVNSDKHGMFVNGTNEVLIVPIDFPDFPGGPEVRSQLEYDKQWLTDWYNYFSNGQSKFNVTTIDSWLRMPKKRSEYDTNGKSGYALTNGNQVMGDQAQPFIEEISKQLDLRKFSTVYTFYPDGDYFHNDLIVRNHRFTIKEGQHNLNFFSWGRNLEGMETLKWSYYIHETLHDFNIIGHAPGNGWPLGMMTNQSGISYALNPWEQFVLGWLPPQQIYCDDARTLKTARVSLSPVEREDRQTKMAVIRLSSTRAIVVESHGIDKWSNFKFGDREFPAGFYSIMAHVVDLDKAAAPPVKSDGSGLQNDEWAWAVWQKVHGGPSNNFNKWVGDRKNLADYVAVLGDSFIIDGIRIKFVGTGDYETIEISKA